MKGRVIALGQYQGHDTAALIVDGVVQDIIADPAKEAVRAGSIYRAFADRPMKGQGGMTVALPTCSGFFRGAQNLKPGQRLLVQVTSIPEPGKAVTVTDKVLFKGRAAIVTPQAPGLNISRRIRDEETRVRLHDLAHEVLGDRAWGLILRSAAAELDDDAVAAELSDLVALADQVMVGAGDKAELLVEGPGAHELAWRDWSVPKPSSIDDSPDALDHLGVLDAIQTALGPVDTLPGGTSMYVEPTRALVAVDVNTGADTSPAAALKANLAAARELPRALRLRGLGGQITVDFAPLMKRDRRQIEQSLRSAFRSDGIETALVGWTPLGHFELQRKRERLPLNEILK